MTKSHLLAAASVAALLASTHVALAQSSGAREILVTATKRATTIQDVPFSLNAQTERDIRNSGSNNLEDISRNVAGLSVQNLGPGQSQVSIRGVSAGQIVRDQPGVKEQVGVYLDESVISLSLFTPDFDLFDLNRVETLRGPQGTLFGSGSVGGTIRYITNQPNMDTFEASMEGNYNWLKDGDSGDHIKGMVNFPLLDDKAALRIVGYHTDYGGFIDAVVGVAGAGGVASDVNDGSRDGFRVSLAFKPWENVTLTPRIVYQDADINGFNREEKYNLYANPFMTTPVTFKERQQQRMLPKGEFFTDQTMLLDLTASIDLGGMELTSVTSHTHRDILVSRDATALTGSVSVDLAYAAGALTIPSNLQDTTKLKQGTQEIRLASTGDDRLQWLIGGFLSYTSRLYAQRLPTPGYDGFTDLRFGAGTSAAVDNGFLLADQPYKADVPYKIRQAAIFAEGTYDLTKWLALTLGGRYYDFEESRRFHSGGLFSNGDNRTDTTTSNGFSPRAIVAIKLDEGLTWNLQASEGFRLGGVNDPLNIPICAGGAGGPDALTYGGHPTYDDETSWNYETGFKLFRNIFSLSGALYHNRIKNLQTSLDAGSCSSRVVFNVPKAHATGAEFELTATPFKGLELSLAASAVTAKYDSTVRNTLGAIIGGLQDGNRLASVPKFQYAGTIAYYWPLGWWNNVEGFVGASAQEIGDRYTQPGDQLAGAGNFVSGLAFGGAPGTGVTSVNLKLPSYSIVNINAGFQGKKWRLMGFINNLTDENAHLAFDRERGGRARVGFHVTVPRMYGVTLRRDF